MKVRRHLVDVVADVQVSDAAQLTFREATAVWQLEKLGERRAYVHLDRIRAALLPPGENPARLLELMFGLGLCETVANETNKVATGNDSHYLEQFTLRGRLLLLAAGLASVATFLVGLWDSLTPEDVRLTPAQREELERRLADSDRNPDQAVPWGRSPSLSRRT